MPEITNIEDLRVLAERRVPRMFYDYCDSGSWTEGTYRANTSDFEKIGIRQKVARNMEGRSTEMTMVGETMKMPVVLAPVGSTGMQHADGEILACRAAHKFGVQFTLSTMSVCSLEDVSENVDNPFWFQLLGQRHKDIKNGLSIPPKPTLPVILDLATKWRWGLAMMKTERRSFRNIVGHVDGVTNTADLAMWASEMFDPKLSWDDIAWIKDRWGGKVILKGILDPEDALEATKYGCDALIVSNHGGRQLDGALSTIEALPGIVEAVGDKIEVHIDSGIRSGQDVLKCMALGAKGTYIGRAFNYGLGAMGEEGVTKALEIIHKELDLSMAFSGETQLQEVDQNTVILPRERAKMALGEG